MQKAADAIEKGDASIVGTSSSPYASLRIEVIDASSGKSSFDEDA
jgi:hypothetical protein